MHLKFRNVNDAFTVLTSLFAGGGHGYDDWWRQDRPNIARKPSRNGEVLVIEEPVTITYTHPRERVLFNPERDCNPFFHLYESLWMLAGRNDVAPLDYYNSRMAEYSDNGSTFHGAYGYRWRKWWGYDQLDWIVDELRANPTTRRCVLQMWDGGGYGPDGPVECTGDLYVATHGGKDVPCNTSVMFLIREVEKYPETPKDKAMAESIFGKGGGQLVYSKDRGPRFSRYLDMTVTNRSNDTVWGALGANVVHFSFLQEYMTARVGAEVGHYHQFSNNLHVYTERFEPEKWLACGVEKGYPPLAVPLVKDPAVFEELLPKFVELNRTGHRVTQGASWSEPFLGNVAQPMCHAFHMHKQKDREAALHWANMIEAEDWKRACVEWLERRYNKKESGK